MMLLLFREIGCFLVQSAAGLEDVVEAGITATNQGFHQVLFLSDCKDLLQSFQTKKTSDWLDSTKMADLIFLTQNGLSCDMILVPYLVVKDIWSVAKLATRVLVNQC